MSIFRNLVWYVKGLKEYTRVGYDLASKTFNPADLEVDCSARSFLITGANSGLGYEAALEIAKRNGTVHLVCRNETLGSKARDDIIDLTKNDKIYLHIVDMSKPKQITSFTSEFTSNYSSLNVLINNAGVLVSERNKTEDGLDVSFATNTMGYYLMTNGLIGLLSKSEEPRVIFVSSGGMLTQKLDSSDFNFEKSNKYDPVQAYAQNKRQQVVMCEELAKAHPGIFFASMHPGWAATAGVKNSLTDFYNNNQEKLRTPAQGADTIIWLAVSGAVQGSPSGKFYQDRVPVATHLPLAWTGTTDADNALFMTRLYDLVKTIVY